MVTGPAVRAADNLLLKALRRDARPEGGDRRRRVRARRRLPRGRARSRRGRSRPAGRRVRARLPAEPAGAPAGPAGRGRAPRGAGQRAVARSRCGRTERDPRDRRARDRRRGCLAGGGSGRARRDAPGRAASPQRSSQAPAGCAARRAASLLAVHGAGTTLGLGTGPVGGATFHIEPLAAPFIVLLGARGGGDRALRAALPRARPRDRGLPGVYNLALLASLAVLVAGNVVTFLVAWESMALLCYLLILRHHKREGVARGAFLFIALSEIGFLLIVLAFAILATQTGTLDLPTIAARAAHVCRPAGARPSTCSRSCGFGFKAGLVPFHIWLPAAHPVAPADGSAFLSGLVIKLGVYGIALFGITLLAGGPAWWGLVTMAFGAISAVLGILYALMERDLKRFLALLEHREHRDHRHRARRGNDVHRLRPARDRHLPADRRAVSLAQPRRLQDAAVPRGRRDRARRGHARHGPPRRPDPPSAPDRRDLS